MDDYSEYYDGAASLFKTGMDAYSTYDRYANYDSGPAGAVYGATSGAAASAPQQQAGAGGGTMMMLIVAMLVGLLLFLIFRG